MKLSNGDIFNARAPLQKLVSLPMPVRTGFLLTRLVGKLNIELTAIEKVRSTIIQKYGQPNGDGQIAVSPASPQFAQFVADIEELMSQEVSVDFEKPVLPGSLEIEPSALMALEKFVDVGD